MGAPLTRGCWPHTLRLNPYHQEVCMRTPMAVTAFTVLLGLASLTQAAPHSPEFSGGEVLAHTDSLPK